MRGPRRSTSSRRDCTPTPPRRAGNRDVSGSTCCGRRTTRTASSCTRSTRTRTRSSPVTDMPRTTRHGPRSASGAWRRPGDATRTPSPTVPRRWPRMTDPARLSTAYGDYRITPLDGIPDRLPYSIRILLENGLRCQDDDRVTRAQADALIDWGSAASLRTAIELTPSRAFLHDTNGVPALVDLATMRDAMAALGGDPARVGPSIPAELVVDHSVIADFFGTPDARERNVALEYERNAERYRFLKWGQHALDGFEVVPPGSGIMHQVNLERLARVVIAEDGWAYPDVCLGTDSHTTMINGLGVLGWGIGGIDAEAVMLGETFGMLIPRVVGFRLTGALPAGATATDLVLTVTQLLRA